VAAWLDASSRVWLWLERKEATWRSMKGWTLTVQSLVSQAGLGLVILELSGSSLDCFGPARFIVTGP
jgi:hypothetical protein